MATSNTAKRTKYKTADGLRIYDLEPLTLDIFAVAGPDWKDPRSIDGEDLPEGFRWITNDEWEKAIKTEVPDEFVIDGTDNSWFCCEGVLSLIESALQNQKATENEIEEVGEDFFDGFDDLMDDLRSDTCNFLEDRGYVVRLEHLTEIDVRIVSNGHDILLDNPLDEAKANLFSGALAFAKNASYPHYFERAGWVLKMLRAEKENKQVEDRLALLDEAVDLLRDAKEYLRTTIPSRDRTVLSSDIQKFLAKVAKN